MVDNPNTLSKIRDLEGVLVSGLKPSSLKGHRFLLEGRDNNKGKIELIPNSDLDIIGQIESIIRDFYSRRGYSVVTEKEGERITAQRLEETYKIKFTKEEDSYIIYVR